MSRPGPTKPVELEHQGDPRAERLREAEQRMMERYPGYVSV